jgi:3-hydroxyisobutyrate dehydrogenase-like beta-hydroxyacid dehydrogenase
MNINEAGVGFVGVGAMGGHNARHLLKSGCRLLVCDRVSERVTPLVAMGAESAASPSDLVRRADIVFTCLPSSEAFVALGDTVFVPEARAGQVFIELGTTIPSEIRRLAARLAERGAFLLDVPVSGGVAGAAKGALRMFAGGDPAAFARCRPLLEAIGGAERLTYCGPSGMGQVLKGVNQLKSALGAAAQMEALAFAVLSGADPAVVQAAFGPADHPLASQITRLASELKADPDSGLRWGVKFRELPYYLAEARANGFRLPLTEALFAFCDAGPRVVDDDNRPAPSFWHELLARMQDGRHGDEAAQTGEGKRALRVPIT